MRSPVSALAALAVAGLLVVASPSLAVGTAEQRCRDLGSSCMCSEPLDFDHSSIGILFDPPDTEGSGARECNNGNSVDTNGPNRTVLASTVGLAGPTYVFRAEASKSGNMYDLNRDFTNRTYCNRSYVRYSNGFPSPRQSPDYRVKGPRFQKGGAHPGFETEWAPWGYPNPWFAMEPQGTFNTPFGGIASNGALPRSGADIRFSDCQQSWCRIEICFDHSANGDGRLTFRGRVVKLSDGSTQYHGPSVSVGSSGQAQSGSNTFPAMWFVQGIGGSNYGYYSHVMVAITNQVSPNFWIGGAVEIEGSGGNPPPPPPPPEPEPEPEPPAAPVLIEVN